VESPAVLRDFDDTGASLKPGALVKKRSGYCKKVYIAKYR
jgi:hypothetical protein